MDRRTQEDVAGIVIAILVCTPLLVTLGYFIYHRIVGYKYEKLFLDYNRKFKSRYLLEIYISLGAALIKRDREDAGEKILYMNAYFGKHFPNDHYDFSDSLSYSYTSPLYLKTITRWLNSRLPGREYKLQIMYFLMGLAMVDGVLKEDEHIFLKRIHEQLNLTQKEFDSIIGLYERYEEARQESTKPKSSIKRSIQISCKIIGVSESASMEEVKKAYRKLVKIHHPDKFINESEHQQKLAHTRFLEIQKAYEMLERFK